MSHIIMHKDGAYNIWSTVVDAPIFANALTIDELRRWIEFEHGQQGLSQLDARLARAHANGTSGLDGESVEALCRFNRAGPKESRLTVGELIARYLTIDSEPSAEAPAQSAPQTHPPESTQPKEAMP